MHTVHIMEVCPRDGWQNLHDLIPLDVKLRYIRTMLDAGVSHIQIGSFVSPKAVPQMADTGIIARKIVADYPGRRINVLVPNLKGVQAAREAGVFDVAYVVSVSESHNKANIGSTHQQSFEALREIRASYPDVTVTLALATAFGCPFEGEVPLKRVLEFVEKGAALGIKKIELGDTIGIGAPKQVAETFKAVKDAFPDFTLAAHMHDTRNNGVLNSWMAMENGADELHGALGGLGGCPFAPGATGNTSTEDLVYLLEKSGIHTGIDVAAIIRLAKAMHGELPGNYSGHQLSIDGAGADCSASGQATPS